VAKLIELELSLPTNYKAIVDQVAKENETDFYPHNTKIDNIEKYDTVSL
jgi:hypothetical protein